MLDVPLQNDFKTPLIQEMINSSQGKIDSYWMAAGCIPQFMGHTMAPMVHTIADNSTDRLQFLVMLQKLYKESGRSDVFAKIINSKSTNGYTVLVYIESAHENNRFAKFEEPAINKLLKYSFHSDIFVFLLMFLIKKFSILVILI